MKAVERFDPAKGGKLSTEELAEEIGISSAKVSQLKTVSILQRLLMLRSAMMI